MTVAQKRTVVSELGRDHKLSQRRSCLLAGLSRSVARYRKKDVPDPLLLRRLQELAEERPRFGYRRIHVFLVREGWRLNRKKVLRIYRELQLQVRRKKRNQAARASRKRKPIPTRVNEAWSMDFMSDALADGRCFRLLNVVDDCSREAVVMEAGISLPAGRVVRALDQAIEERGRPARITVDNGPEFRSRTLDAWAYGKGIDLCFIQPGKPTENAFVESFNGRVREECLNQHCFRDLEEARAILEDWREDYNTVRPHGSLNNRTPREYAALLGEGYPSPSTGQAAACRPQPNPQTL